MDSHYWDIAAKVLAGKASLAEQVELNRWREANPAHEEQYQAQQKLWKLTAPETAGPVDTDAAWSRVRGNIQPQVQQKKNKVIPLFGPAWRVAASVALLIGLVWLVQLYFFPSDRREVIVAGDNQREVLLPDSSRVWLNRGSTLTFQTDLAGATRAVALVGEGFFEVHRDSLRPFIISTGGARAEVLGTSFNLRAYPQENRVELVVETGTVALSGGGGTAAAIVPAGQAGYLDLVTRRLETKMVSDGNAWAWRAGRLQFAERPLREVLPAVERYFGVTLHLQHPGLGHCRFTGSFQQAGLQEVLQVLEATLQMEIQRQTDQSYLLTGEGCGREQVQPK
ncbi:DUF4974 domain-containing protein [soil metagenome]